MVAMGQIELFPKIAEKPLDIAAAIFFTDFVPFL